MDEKGKLIDGLRETKKSFWGKFLSVFKNGTGLHQEWEAQLEELLIASDVGVDTTIKIIDRIERSVSSRKKVSSDDLQDILKQELLALIPDQGGNNAKKIKNKPYVILAVGVNGVGKTTTVAKMAYRYNKAKKTVVLAAADTYRAAATEQLGMWSSRMGLHCVKEGTTPSSVAYDALNYAKNKKADVLIIDTAGRLHNNKELMGELSKVYRVTEKFLDRAPDEVVLVLDGTTGQNTFEQVRVFSEVIKVDSIAVTKLDGTAKAGFIIGLLEKFGIPVRYVGLGEQMQDLRDFDFQDFIDTLFDE